MLISFLNPQGNFDAHDSYWTRHPDFGGQLVYVKELALAMASLGHQVDIVTRQIIDPSWPEFSGSQDHYPQVENVRIVRLPCGPDRFLPKEELWPALGSDWVPEILRFYQAEGRSPSALTGHYADGGLSAALVANALGIPFTFTGHSLGAQKMDKLNASPENLAALDERYHFASRIFAERVSMCYAGCIVTSTLQERMEQYGHKAYHGAVDPQDERRFAVIAPGVNRKVFHEQPLDSDDRIQKRLEASIQRDLIAERRELPLVVCSSRLERKKNHLGLVQAFASSKALQSTANLAIIVSSQEDPLNYFRSLPPDESSILEEIAGLLNKFHLWGKVTTFLINNQPDLAAAYRCLAQRKSVFALTSFYEPFGLAPLEAMSAGLPAVVTRNGGPAESMQEGAKRFGVLVDPADPQDIARGLLEVLELPLSWFGFRQAGIERILAKYTWERTAEGYLEVLERLLKVPSSRNLLPIPPFFEDPRQAISVKELAEVYF